MPASINLKQNGATIIQFTIFIMSPEKKGISKFTLEIPSRLAENLRENRENSSKRRCSKC